MKNQRNLRQYLRFLKHAHVAFSKFGVTSFQQKVEVFPDLRKAYFDYAWEPKEFFQFNYEGKSNEEIYSYVTAKEQGKMVYFFNSPKEIAFLQNKWDTYSRYKDFYKREVLFVTEHNILSFEDMLKTHDRLILKPIDGTYGKGIKIITCGDYIGCAHKLLGYYKKGFIAEEIIYQDSSLRKLHPESVNTIRIYSVCYGQDVVIFHPWLRIGKGTSIVDNASSGGIGAALDFNSGCVLLAGDKSGNRYETHPDSHENLIGFQIPHWKELIDTVKCIALLNNNLHYAGWDMALSDKGWVMVEGNPRAQIGFQIMEMRGFREDLNLILDKFGLKEEYYNCIK